ncbi:MAG: DUF1592 domain-containing protein [Deltaproteobacteria bacterium]|nr:DUF1592 domain-containing protein [Deltaproteobacteria bacterium]
MRSGDDKRRSGPRGFIGIAFASFVLAAACQGSVGNAPIITGDGGLGTGGGLGGNGATATGGNGAGPGGSGSGSGATGGIPFGSGGSGTGNAPGTGGTGNTGGTSSTACVGDPVAVQKRMVRLSFNQVTTTIRTMLGNTIADSIVADPVFAADLLDSKHRGFPPLASPREGSVITDGTWVTGDQIAQKAAKYVLDNFAAVTRCTGTGAALDTCAQTWLRNLAAAGYRRPLTAAETTTFNQLYTDLKDVAKVGLTTQQATQFSVYGILESPHFLYRTEFGTSATAAGVLTPYEVASEISYFLTDGPPDVPLLAAAANNTLSTTEQVTAQVNRILATAAAKTNLESAMFGYFAIPNIESVVIDTNVFKGWNDGLRNSLEHESDLFLRDVLWNGKVADLLTSRTSILNATLASFYGVTNFPPAGTTLDADGFGKVTLPATRAGILTQGGFLVARARPMAGSVIGRGLLINAAVLCVSNPPFPTALAATIDMVNAQMMNDTERDKAKYRGMTSPCSSCHVNFDSYGLTLENFDGIGQYRTADEKGRPIDASVTLPALVGGGTVANAVEMAAQLAKGGAFANCVAKNLLNFALAETPSNPLPTNACAIRNVSNAFTANSDGTFTSLVRGIAVSPTLLSRSGGLP